VIYAQRRQILGGKTLEEDLMEMAGELVEEIVEEYTAHKLPEEWDLKAMGDALYRQFGFRVSPENLDGDLHEVLYDLVKELLEAKREEIGPELFQQLQQMVMLQIVDNHWKEHLLSMDHLRDGIGLRGYAQVDPLREYQREGYEMFMDLINRIQADSVGTLFHLQVQPHHEPPPEARRQATPMAYSHGGEGGAPPKQRQKKKVGRNDPCPCGSGKKYKKCCGK
jgi:preprotein translocase subunit SecA